MNENFNNSQQQQFPWYLQTWFIAIMFTFSWFVIPFFVGIALVIMQHNKLKIAEEILKEHGDFNNFNTNVNNRKQTLYNESEYIRNEIANLKKELSTLNAEILVEHFNFSDYDGLTSEQCKNELALLKQETKELIQNDDALSYNPNSRASSKSIRDNSKQILRIFNAECDNVLLNLKTKNIDSSRNKIVKSFESLNKIFTVDDVHLSKKLLDNKLEELNLVYSFELKKEQEKEIQKAIKEQMLEEEKVRREIEATKKKIEKDQAQTSKEINRLMGYLQKAPSDAEKQMYIDKIKDLEAKLQDLEKDKATVLVREANATAGYVYVISNIGSFGEDVYKIGMTRRLEPMDRVKELSSASVPFEFDVHAMIFSNDAPKLETALHNKFKNNSVNKVNYRKEFFKVKLDDIEAVVTEEFNNTAQFTKVPVATEYRESLRIAEQTQ